MVIQGGVAKYESKAKITCGNFFTVFAFLYLLLFLLEQQ